MSTATEQLWFSSFLLACTLPSCLLPSLPGFLAECSTAHVGLLSRALLAPSLLPPATVLGLDVSAYFPNSAADCQHMKKIPCIILSYCCVLIALLFLRSFLLTTQYFETALHRRVLQRAGCAVSDGKTVKITSHAHRVESYFVIKLVFSVNQYFLVFIQSNLSMAIVLYSLAMCCSTFLFSSTTCSPPTQCP